MSETKETRHSFLYITRSSLCIIAGLGALTSCGNNSKGSVKSKFKAYEEMAVVAPIDQDQRNIATRICYAYESKYNNFRSNDFLTSIYRFNLVEDNCSKNLSYQVLVRLVDGTSNNSPMHFTNDSGQKFSTIIQTNKNGYLSQLCDKVKNNLPIDNTTTMGDQQIQITFFKDTFDSYIIKYFSKMGETYKAQQAETFRVRTQFNFNSSNGNILGMDEDYSDERICEQTKNKTYKFIQKFDKRLNNNTF